MSKEQASLHIFGTFFRQSLLFMLRFGYEIWTLRSWAEIQKENALKTNIYQNKNSLTAGLFSFNSFAFHISQSLKIHFFSQIILQSTHFTGLLHFFIPALKEFNAPHLLWTSPGLVITPKLPSYPFSTPSPRKSSLIQNSKYQGPAALQIYFISLRVHISHSHSLFLACFFAVLYICFSYSLPFHSVSFKLLKNAQVCSRHDMGKREQTIFFTLPIFQHCWSAHPHFYSLNNNHFSPLTLSSVNLTSLPTSLCLYQQLFPFIRHFWNPRGSPEAQDCGL